MGAPDKLHLCFYPKTFGSLIAFEQDLPAHHRPFRLTETDFFHRSPMAITKAKSSEACLSTETMLFSLRVHNLPYSCWFQLWKYPCEGEDNRIGKWRSGGAPGHTPDVHFLVNTRPFYKNFQAGWIIHNSEALTAPRPYLLHIHHSQRETVPSNSTLQKMPLNTHYERGINWTDFIS